MNNPWANEPTPDTLAARVRRFKIDCYLRGQHCVLWPGGHYDLTDEKERAKAVAFIEDLLDSVG